MKYMTHEYANRLKADALKYSRKEDSAWARGDSEMMKYYLGKKEGLQLAASILSEMMEGTI